MTPISSKGVGRAMRGVVGIVALIAALPGALLAQSDMPSAEEVREALATLKRFERALAEMPPTEGDTGLQPQLLSEPLTTTTVASGPSPQVVAVPSSYSLTLSGDMALDGAMFKDGAPFLHNDGGAAAFNTAVGWKALISATPGYIADHLGKRNTAVGHGALLANSIGFANTSTGYRALRNNTEGSGNTAVGFESLLTNVDGSLNTAFGFKALAENVTGHENTAIGDSALRNNATGSRNTAIGDTAGYYWTTGDNNIAIGRGSHGVAGESGTIRIGGTGAQNRTYVEGIFGAMAAGGSHVYVNLDNKLGTAVSSARFKQDIRDLEGVSKRLLDLRPVSFRYKLDDAIESRDGTEAEPTPLEYGLIAEEVAEVFPELVTNDAEGDPFTVRYHLLAPLLLNEVQRLTEINRDQQHEVADLRRRLEWLERKRSLDVRIPIGARRPASRRGTQ